MSPRSGTSTGPTACGASATTRAVCKIVSGTSESRAFGRRPALLWFSLAIWLVAMFTPYFGVLLLGFCLFYVLSPLYTGKIDPTQAAVESRSRAQPR